MLVQDLLWAAAARTPERIALVADGQRFSYRELAWRARRFAGALRAAGLQRGDRVVLWLPNQAELVVAIFGVLAAGGVFVIASDAQKPTQVDTLRRHCTAAWLVTQGRRRAVVEPWLGTAGLRGGHLVGGEPALSPWADFAAATGDGEPLPLPAVGIDRDLACLIYTSGSTGEAKGVMSAHHQMVFAVDAILAYLGTAADDVVLCALPLAFDYGLYQLLMTCRVGATLVLERSFAFPAQCLQRIAEQRVTGLPGVPTLWALLLGMDLGGFDLTSLRWLTNTAAALPPAHIRQLQAAFPGVRIHAMYGLTETKRTLQLPPEWLDRKAGAVGWAIPGTEVWLEDPDGNRCGDEQVGELVVRGGHVMSGYWNDPAGSAARFPPGPLPGERLCRTGDLFRRDADGCHWFVGRRDDLLKVRGEKLWPREVEQVLCEAPGVRAAVVVGVPEPRFGQLLVAVVVADPAAAEPRVLQQFCRTRLEDWKVPARVVFTPALPCTPNGKVDRAAVRALVEATLD